MEPDAPHRPGSPPAPWWKSVSGLVICGLLLVGGFYLVTQHTVHLWGLLPFLLILACPLMHIFHHHGHRKHPSVAPPSPGAPDMSRTGGA